MVSAEATLISALLTTHKCSITTTGVEVGPLFISLNQCIPALYNVSFQFPKQKTSVASIVTENKLLLARWVIVLIFQRCQMSLK